MTEAGMAKIDQSSWDKASDYDKLKKKDEVEAPEFMINGLKINRKALENFNKLSPSCKKQYIVWISSAKKEETKKKRLNEALTMLEQNQKLGMK